MSDLKREAKIFYLIGGMRALIGTMFEALDNDDTFNMTATKDKIMVIDALLKQLIYKESIDE